MTENTEARQTWRHPFFFLITCIGATSRPIEFGVIGNMEYFIPLFISTCLIGIPIFCLEMFIGQFGGLGAIAMWEINPLFKGLGYSMVTLAAITSICFTYEAYPLHYFFGSMQSSLPWTKCDDDDYCCLSLSTTYNISSFGTQECYKTVMADDKYWEKHFSYRSDYERSVKDVYGVKWDLTLCNLLVWIIVCGCLIKGLKSMEKAMVFFVSSQHIIMVTLLILAVTLDGATDGINFYMTPDFTRLLQPWVWQRAASQVLIDLLLGRGIWITMSSYNVRRTNVLWIGVLFPLLTVLLRMCSTIAVSALGGHYANAFGTHAADLSIVFFWYTGTPGAIASVSPPQFWSVVYFLQLFCHLMCRKLLLVETFLAGFQGEFKILRRKWVGVIFRVLVCASFFLLGLPETSTGGVIFVEDVVYRLIWCPICVIVFLEMALVVWVYTPCRLAHDVMIMFGNLKRNSRLFIFYYSWAWMLVAPVLILVVFGLKCDDYESFAKYLGRDKLEDLFGWLIMAFILSCIPAWAVWKIVKTVVLYRPSDLMKLIKPTPKWGFYKCLTNEGNSHGPNQESETVETAPL